MSVQSVLQRVDSDPKYAKALEAKARAAAATTSVDGPEWSALVDAVADSPEERAKIMTALKSRPAASPEALGRMTSRLEDQVKLEAVPTTTTTTTTITGTSMTTLATTLDCGIAMTTILA